MIEHLSFQWKKQFCFEKTETRSTMTTVRWALCSVRRCRWAARTLGAPYCRVRARPWRPSWPRVSASRAEERLASPAMRLRSTSPWDT